VASWYALSQQNAPLNPSLTPTPKASSSPTTQPTAQPTVSPTTPSTPTPTITPTPTPTPTPTQITTTFNFDTGTPTLSVRTPTPFDQTSNGITAHFSSPADTLQPAFSVQNTNTLQTLSVVINSLNFTGNFLWPNSVNHDPLYVKFNRNVTSITLNFKTAELHDPGPGQTGSTIRITAYLDTTANAVGSSVIKNGIEPPTDTYPEGTLTIAGGQPFNLVVIDLPFPTQGASGILVDNIAVTA
jgi:hypothetical protein